ncbi:holo-ACP synthase [Candidatus Aerophobetes bacterium]|nr:holo-ACP synthase [Candidatus Aerophobetes bacterium]
MIKGIGVDLIEIERIEKALQKWDELLEKKILTPREIEEIEYRRIRRRRKLSFIAGRFAAKEAIFKSLGIAPRWQEVDVLPGEKGAPLVTLHRETLKLSQNKGIKKMLVSISHTRNLALAQAIALGDSLT